MRKKRFFILSTLIMVWLAGCAQPELPSNAITTEGARGARYLDRIDFSYVPSRTHDFSQLRLCVAQNVSNNNVTLHDVSGSWVGPYTGNYYRNDNYQQIAGTAGIFKLVDERNAMLIAVGTTSAIEPGFPMPMTDIIKYEVTVGLQGNEIKLLFTNITRAWQTTGTAVNDGFQPVGIWQGTRADNVYRGLEVIATRIRACAP